MNVVNAALHIKKEIKEADVFQGADPEDIEDRKFAGQKENRRKRDVGLAKWRAIPEKEWPESREEDLCPVCLVDDMDFEQEDGDVDYERHVYTCNNCKSRFEIKYEVERQYDGTEVIELGETPTESVKEADDPFKGADKDDVAKRKAEHDANRAKALKAAGILPVDTAASDLTQHTWYALEKLENRLDDLRAEKGTGTECECDMEKLEEAGEDPEYCSLFGEDYIENYCLRCGGYVDRG